MWYIQSGMKFKAEGYTAGISTANRRRLERLHRESQGTVTVGDAARLLGIDRTAAARLLAHWCAQGWARRVRRGLYVLVPLGAEGKVGVVADPWVLLARAFAPCYVGGWSACEHWDLTEQIFRTVVVVTGKPVRPREGEIAGNHYIARVVSPTRLFGTSTVWRGATPVEVSDPSRTIVDILDVPALGGGMRHVADVVREYFRSEHRDDRRLAEYARRLSNRAVFKRLGFLIERLGISAPDLAADCLAARSAGYVRLDPDGPARGRLLRRWGLRVNIGLPAAS
jgi:predicted transcriptional regulator of viral defense system